MVSARDLAKELRDLQSSSGWEDAESTRSARRSNPVPERRSLREVEDEEAESSGASGASSRRGASRSSSEIEPEPEPEPHSVQKEKDEEVEAIWRNIKKAGEHIDRVMVG
ncbi:hypothetical protein HBH70_092080 [Parastagonospora nodorum]|nr:hypothetical protein HBH52_125980 [Parastagonospora nodorum]KAH4081221.1 hypothetical protein HBH46_227490 [Parastagonospora nodorum]KAH4122888.1 hypothetical protein HBH47_082120 [Parastagonospora nodorum]KAH4300132.1 hypothetical protein HBI01_111670 [Parastagonospora nodorum]KAH4318469.1 hypothetical protein HBI02_001890 [Parastagonospora nodorum]